MLLSACFMLSVLFDPEGGGAVFLWNVIWLQQTAQCYIWEGLQHCEDFKSKLLLCYCMFLIFMDIQMECQHINAL